MSKLITFYQYVNRNFDFKSKLMFIATLLLCILSSLLTSIVPVMLAKIVDQLFETVNTKNWFSLVVLTLTYIFIQSMTRLLPILSHWLRNLLHINAKLFFSKSYLKYIYQQNMDYFEKNNAGAISQHSMQINNEVFILLEKFISGFFGPILNVIFAMTIILITGDWIIFLFFMVYLFSFIAITTIFTEKTIPLKKAAMDSSRNSYSRLSDFSENIIVAKNNNALRFLFDHYQSTLQLEKNENVKFGKCQISMSLAHSILSLLLFVGCFIYVLYCVVGKDYTIGYFVMITSYIAMLSTPVEGLGKNYSQVKQSITFLDNFIRKFNKTKNEEGRLTLEHSTALDVVINNLSFKYPNTDKDILTHICTKIPAGKFVTFTGSSGSGKTTLVKLLATYYEEYHGDIEINGNNIKHYSVDNLKDKIYFVTQEELIFMDTLRFNLLVAKPNASDQELLTALAMANFSYQDSELSHNDNLLDIQLGNRGTAVSGGQRQRISLARLFLRHPALIIIDESTSSLDLVNEKIVLDNINKAFPNATKISISHRPTTFSYSDLIYVFEQGQIFDHGSLNELLQRNDYIQKIVNQLNKPVGEPTSSN